MWSFYKGSPDTINFNNSWHGNQTYLDKVKVCDNSMASRFGIVIWWWIYLFLKEIQSFYVTSSTHHVSSELWPLNPCTQSIWILSLPFSIVLVKFSQNNYSGRVPDNKVLTNPACWHCTGKYFPFLVFIPTSLHKDFAWHCRDIRPGASTGLVKGWY